MEKSSGDASARVFSGNYGIPLKTEKGAQPAVRQGRSYFAALLCDGDGVGVSVIRQ